MSLKARVHLRSSSVSYRRVGLGIFELVGLSSVQKNVPMVQLLLKCCAHYYSCTLLVATGVLWLIFVLCFGCFAGFHLNSVTPEKHAVIFKPSSGQDSTS